MKNLQIDNIRQEKMPVLPAGKFVEENSVKFVLVEMLTFGPLVNIWLPSVLCLILISCLFPTFLLKVSAPMVLFLGLY